MVSSGANNGGVKNGASGGIRRGRPAMRGSGALQSRPHPNVRPEPTTGKRRVLFICIGNSCRSQMAEAFARAYGGDIIDARSAGINPATMVAPLTVKVLSEKNIAMDGHFPKSLDSFSQENFDLVVNMSGARMTAANTRLLVWPVEDPIGQSEMIYRNVAAKIEAMVMRLILELRNAR